MPPLWTLAVLAFLAAPARAQNPPDSSGQGPANSAVAPTVVDAKKAAAKKKPNALGGGGFTGNDGNIIDIDEGVVGDGTANNNSSKPGGTPEDIPRRTPDGSGSVVTQPPQGKPSATTPDQQAAREHERRALEDYKQGDSAAAKREIELAAALEPDNPRIRQLREIVIPHVLTPFSQRSLDDKARPLMAAKSAQALPDGGSQAILASPLALASPRRQGPVASPIQEFLKVDPAKDAVLKMRLKDYAGAEDSLSKQLARDPNNWLSYRARALARRGLKRFAESIDDATRALALNPKDGWSRDIRSSDLTDLGRPKEALVDAEEALRLDAGDAAAYAARGQALEGLGRGDEALADLKRAAELDPQYADLFHAALARREGPFRDRRPLAFAAAGLVSLALLAAVVLGHRSALQRMTPAPGAMREADRLAVPRGFELVRRLGEGGMGVVYEAVDRGLERRVALKRMREEIAGDERERRRFIKEARTVAALRHPNIVEIYSIVEEGPEVFLVFELLAGQTLDRLIGGKALEPRRAAELAAQIASALDHAHARGVIHQDLKPSNVLLAGETAKVMDFGIARRAQATMSTTTRNEIVGTPAYMAPEQEQGSPTQASDVFSLGVCAYEMLSGRAPFPGGGLMQKLKRDYPKLSAFGLPERLDDVVARALDPDPVLRLASAGELARELTAALSPSTS